ncbi:MAG: ABC transporter ATP-binding protein [Planctomycetes bacterium]|nr:ABC transporter ATP-binding protein [Planctomycetota bacterium]
MSHALEVFDLQKDFPTTGESVRALVSVTLSVSAGEFVAIMGASGSGKSTLLHLIGGLDRPTAGAIVIEGRDLGQMTDRERTLFRRRRLGIVFQQYNLLPTLTAVENVALPAMVDGRGSQTVSSKANELLELVDLGHRGHHRPQAMSGGEQQRLAIARALMNDPVILLADEPTGNLDSRHGQAIWGLLSRLVRENQRTVLAVTHEPGGATYADRVIVLKDGRIAGEIMPGGEGHASLVAARYAELVD